VYVDLQFHAELTGFFFHCSRKAGNFRLKFLAGRILTALPEHTHNFVVIIGYQFTEILTQRNNSSLIFLSLTSFSSLTFISLTPAVVRIHSLDGDAQEMR
jgi:hypothetical protein